MSYAIVWSFLAWLFQFLRSSAHHLAFLPGGWEEGCCSRRLLSVLAMLVGPYL